MVYFTIYVLLVVTTLSHPTLSRQASSKMDEEMLDEGVRYTCISTKRHDRACPGLAVKARFHSYPAKAEIIALLYNKIVPRLKLGPNLNVVTVLPNLIHRAVWL